MKLIILDHYSQASEWAAKYIRNRIIQFNPGPDKYFTLGLPTGALWDGEGGRGHYGLIRGQVGRPIQPRDCKEGSEVLAL